MGVDNISDAQRYDTAYPTLNIRCPMESYGPTTMYSLISHPINLPHIQ